MKSSARAVYSGGDGNATEVVGALVPVTVWARTALVAIVVVDAMATARVITTTAVTRRYAVRYAVRITRPVWLMVMGSNASGHDGLVSEPPRMPGPAEHQSAPTPSTTGSGGDNDLQRSAIIIGSLVALMWLVEIVDTVVHHKLDRFGVRPHNIGGLRGIAFAPFLHAGFGHLIGNTVPFAVMGWLVLSGGLRRFVTVSTLVVVGSGIGAWVFGNSNEVHIGASGVVFGYLGYLLLRGVFERRIGQLAVGVGVGVLYGGALRSVLPTHRGISWQGHLFGFSAGCGAAWLLSRSTVRSVRAVRAGSPS